MKTTKYALLTALGLVALVATGAAQADTIFTATGTTNTPSPGTGNPHP